MEIEEIYELYAERIMRFFSNKAASPNDIDDLMHTTFLRYIERSGREKIRLPLRFLYRIAHHVLFEYWRKRKRADLHDEVGELSLADMGPGITSLIARDQKKQQVLDALRSLRLDYQVAVELRYWERLPYEEIAEVMDTTTGTVGTWLNRSRKQLEKKLGALYPATHRSDDQSSSNAGQPGPEHAPGQDDPCIQGLMDGVRDLASGRDEDDA
ncbi:MAG: RNA polymerase sigma factor [Myxococcota bacterium]